MVVLRRNFSVSSSSRIKHQPRTKNDRIDNEKEHRLELQSGKNSTSVSEQEQMLKRGHRSNYNDHHAYSRSGWKETLDSVTSSTMSHEGLYKRCNIDVDDGGGDDDGHEQKEHDNKPNIRVVPTGGGDEEEEDDGSDSSTSGKVNISGVAIKPCQIWKQRRTTVSDVIRTLFAMELDESSNKSIPGSGIVQYQRPRPQQEPQAF